MTGLSEGSLARSEAARGGREGGMQEGGMPCLPPCIPNVDCQNVCLSGAAPLFAHLTSAHMAGLQDQ